MTSFKRNAASRLTLLLLSLSAFADANSIDKEKILAIIKAAKQHKPVPSLHKPDTREGKASSHAPVIVYKRRAKPIVFRQQSKKQKARLMEREYGALPTIAPTSILLKERFQSENQQKNKTFRFKSSATKSASRDSINTVAKKINF